MQIAPTEVRGALGSVNQLVICLGILGALLVNVVYPPTAWRTMFYLSALPAVILALGDPLLPQAVCSLIAVPPVHCPCRHTVLCFIQPVNNSTQAVRSCKTLRVYVARRHGRGAREPAVAVQQGPAGRGGGGRRQAVGRLRSRPA